MFEAKTEPNRAVAWGGVIALGAVSLALLGVLIEDALTDEPIHSSGPVLESSSSPTEQRQTGASSPDPGSRPRAARAASPRLESPAPSLADTERWGRSNSSLSLSQDPPSAPAIQADASAPIATLAEPTPQLGPDGGQANTEVEAVDVTPSQPCGTVTCSEGEICCNESCSICAAPGVYCDTRPCEMRALQLGALCGTSSCTEGATCCCGTCVPPGQACDPDECVIDSRRQLTVPCGMRTLCDEGEVCCNLSCGICTQPGETCSQEPCD